MPWKEGESGNPSGRPKKQYSITAMLRTAGEQVVDPETGKTRAQELAEQMWALAENGDRTIAQYIFDRLDGKPKERVETEGETLIRIVWDDSKADTAPSAEGVPGE